MNCIRFLQYFYYTYKLFTDNDRFTSENNNARNISIFIDRCWHTAACLAFIARTLRLIAKENQCILPSQAWFLAMPFFNIYWNFEVTRRLTDSLNNEFFDRKIPVDDNPTRKWGMLNAWTFLLMNIPLPSVFLVSLRVVNLVYFVTYWIKINQYRVLLVEHNKFREINDISENKEES